LVYFAFDLLHFDGEDLMRLPLLERKARLEALLADAPPVLRFSGHIVGNGARVFGEGSRLGVVLSRVHWVRPELVAEVTYLTWTADGLLRHVVYEGLREDKSPRDVRRTG
jgi:ATP-dependent DNA ligase